MIKKYWQKRKKLKDLVKDRHSSVVKKIFLWLVFLGIGAGLLGVIAIVAMITILSIGLPDVNDLSKLNAAQSTEIFDRNGELLYTIHGEENREYVAYENISKFLVDATVATEDDGFWEHGGYDLKAIVKAGIHEIFGIGSARGGSTITQQYIKNTFLSSEHSYSRKVKEVILAVRLEKEFSKEKILELYLNRIPYGNNAYGIQKASEIYFGKDAKDLTLAESVVLAALPQAPSRYNPYGDNKYTHLLVDFPEDSDAVKSESDLKWGDYEKGLIGQYIQIGKNEVYLQGRTDHVLKRLSDLGKITDEERQKALNELQKIVFKKRSTAIKHPHFVLYIKQMLEDKYGKDVVEQGGLKVYTTIDTKLQDYAEQVAMEYGEKNETKYGADNMAILTINANTGQILAMVGSRDYFNEDIDGNVNVVFRPRQPGSSFKPFVFAQAFYNGYAPGSVVYDVPMKLGIKKPSNYDGSWEGQMTLRKALGQSRNIPAIKAYFLAKEQGPIIDFVERLGITTLDKNHDYGYPLALGAGEIPLSEMVTAYSTFANGGKKPELVSILKIENSNGEVLEEYKQKEFKEVMDPQIAYLINSILSDKSVAVGSSLFVNGKINAAKTGTSTKANKQTAGGAVRPSDAWTIGYSPTITTGVWVGNTSGEGLGYNANGLDTAAPIFNKVMTKALENESNKEFPEPDKILHIEVSKTSGKKVTASTPDSMVVTEIFPSFGVPTEFDDSFKRVKIDKVSGYLATEYTPEDAVIDVLYQNYEPIADLFNWKNEILAYFADKSNDSGAVRTGLPPTKYDNVHTAKTLNSVPSIVITSPSTNSKVTAGNTVVNVDIDAQNVVSLVEYYLDGGKRVYSTSTAPYRGNINISKFLKVGSVHTITAKVIDSIGYSSSSSIEVKVVAENDKDNDKDNNKDSNKAHPGIIF